MDNRKRRSVLRKSINDPTTPRIKRRISFSGKHLVREFHNEEEPKTWNNSYEISDNLNIDETTSHVCVSKKKPMSYAPREPLDNKEHVTQEVSLNINSEVNSNSTLSTTKDFINLPCQNSKILNMENSIDITLYGKEIEYHNANKHEQTLADDNITTTSVYSFSCDDYERGIMHAAKKGVNNETTLQETTANSEQMDVVSDINFICTNNKQPKEPVTIYMNDSISYNNDTQKPLADKRNTFSRSLAMEFTSPTRARYYGKENIVPTSMANATINQISHMDIDGNIFGPPSVKVNVEKESQDFQHKLNELSFLQESDDNMQINTTQTAASEVNTGAIPKVKSSRQTINFNHSIEVSPVNAKSNPKRQIVHFNEDIRPFNPCRQTINFNDEGISQESPTAKEKTSRQTINFNEDIRVSPDKFSRTINFNDEGISQESPTAKEKTSRQTINFNEDIRVSPDKLSQELAVAQQFNMPGSVRKKVVVRKICTPLVNKSAKQIDLDQQRILRFKKKLEQDAVPASAVDGFKHVAAEKSFNMSLSSAKNSSLSSDSYSPIIPSEFKVLNFKELNDELERGKIHVYSNAPKTPNTDRKKAVSHFTKNINCPTFPKQRKTLVFEDADIPLAAADDTLTNVKSNDYFANDEHKKKANNRYSQADDMMLNSTSFLTRAKLGDETASRNSSKRDVTQTNNIDILFDETLKESSTKLGNVDGGNSFFKSLKGNSENATLSSMFNNAKPIFRQTITSLRNDLYENDKTLNIQNFRDSNLENNSNEATKKDQKRKTMHLNDDIELCDNGFNHHQMEKSHTRITIDYDSNMNIEDENIDIQNEQDSAKASNKENMTKAIVSRKTLYLNHDIEDQETPTLINENKRSTIFFKNDIENKSAHQFQETDDDKYCYSTQEQRQKHARHTMHFDNGNIEGDLNALNNDIISTKIRFETSREKTLHLNEEIESHRADFNLEAIENKNVDNLEAIAGRQQKTMLFDNDVIDAESANVIEKLPRETLCINKYIESNDLCFENTNKEDFCRTKLFLNNNDVEIVSDELQLQNQKHLRHTMHFDNGKIENEESHREEYQKNIHTNHTFKEKEAKRQTIYSNDDIEHDNSNSSNRNRDENTDIQEPVVRSTKYLQQTILFDNKVDIDDAVTCMVENDNQIVKCRQTLYFNQDLNESLEKSKHTSNETFSNKPLYVNSKVDEKEVCVKMSQTRKSIHTPEVMDLTFDDTKNQENNQNQARKSIYTAQCMDITLAQTTDQTNNEKVSQSRKSIYNTQCMDFSLNTMESNLNEEHNQNEHQTQLSNTNIVNEVTHIPDGDNQFKQNSKNFPNRLFETTMNEMNEKFEYNVSLVETDKDIEANVSTDKKKTLHFDNNNEIAIDQTFNSTIDQNYNVPEPKGNSLDVATKNQLLPIQKINSNNRKTIYYEQKDAYIEHELPMNENSTIMSEEKVTKCIADKRKSLHFDKNNDISIEENYTPTDCNFPTKTLLNVAKMSLHRNPTKSFHLTPRTVSYKMDSEMSEFNAHEMGALGTPVHEEISMKRMPANLTPILSKAKKRQTLLFDNCSMDEEPTNNTSMKTSVYTAPKENNNNDAKHVLNDQPWDSLGIVINESVELKTSSKQIKSRIPIPLSSGKKSNTGYSNDTNIEPIQFQSENLELMDESIEVLRRARTFTQRRDTDVAPTNNHGTEFEFKELMEAKGQPSIFEGNPITISDVSVFFTAQRNSNACYDNSVALVLPDPTVSMPDVTVAVPDIDIERKKRESLQNRYINLTYNSPMEDIEQTRISLVRTLSDDDDNDEEEKQVENLIDMEPPIPMSEAKKAETQYVPERAAATAAAAETAAATLTECNVDVTIFKLKRRISDLRNISAVCRKCKRCQNTFLNETASSSSDSFVLPELPPLPDLGVDRLLQLRKRPTIADVHVLWQRLSLDRTVINPVDDSQMLSDTEDDNVLLETIPAVKTLRKFEKEMQELEMKLLAPLPERTTARRKSFVIRLEELLRNTPNLIFDYQMQIRGIYLFSHVKMLTISVVLHFEELDPLGIDINLKEVKIQKSHVPEKNWKPIDFVLDFQFKLNLPFDLQSICEGCSTTEAGIFKMLQTIDNVCMDTVKMGNDLQRVVFGNQATLIRDECRTYVRKINRKIVNGFVEKTEVRIELLNLKKLSFKDITTPPLHHFREEIHLLPIGLTFLDAFLPNPLNYLKKSC